MGCWNETCMGTNLPITGGEPCVAVVLLESPYLSAGIYATNAYHPVLAVQGNYDEYGGLEDIRDEEAALALLKKLPNLRKKDSAGHMRPYVPKSVNEFIRDAGDSLYITGVKGVFPTKGKTILAVRVVFLKPAFVDLSTADPAGRSYLDCAINPMLDRAGKSAAAWKAKKKELDKLPHDGYRHCEVAMEEATLQSEVRHMLTELKAYFNQTWAHPAASAYLMDTFMAFPGYAQDSARIIIQATSVLDTLRKAWHIPSGGGSQQTVCHVHSAFARLYEQICDELDSDEE